MSDSHPFMAIATCLAPRPCPSVIVPASCSLQVGFTLSFCPLGKRKVFPSFCVPSQFLYFVLPHKINDSYFLLWLWKPLISVASMASSYDPLLPSSVQMSWVCSWVGRAGLSCMLHSCWWCFLPVHTFTFLPQSPIFSNNGRTFAIVQGIPIEKGWCKWEVGTNKLSFLY